MTLASKKQYALLVVFNIFTTVYIFLHKTLVPTVLYLLRDPASAPREYDFGFWWVYHAILWYWLVKEKEAAAQKIVAVTSVALVLLVLFLGLELWSGGLARLEWKGISDTITYGFSFFVSAFIWSYFRKIERQ